MQSGEETMNGMLPAFAAAWTRSWTDDPIELGETPPFPLARTVKMPSGHPYESGALSFRLGGLRLHGAAELDLDRCSLARDGTRVVLGLGLRELVLHGRYAVEVKPDPVVPIDSGGNLMDLAPEACAPIAAGTSPGDPPLDPEKEQWLENARHQRTILAQSENGQQLLGVYNTHNETYDELFRTSPSLVTTWQAGGATKEMARDTHGAVKADGVVNDAQKQYTGGVTYNGNAFVQQTAVALTAAITAGWDGISETPPPADDKYWSAGLAALSFGKGVATATNNTPQTVNEMKASEVHGTVKAYDGPVPKVDPNEGLKLLSDGDSGAGGDDGPDQSWIVLGESDRERLRHLRVGLLKEKAEDAAVVGQPLFEGACEARIRGAHVVLEIVLGDGIERDAVQAAVADVPAFDLEIDDGGWADDAGEIARRRVERLYFLRTMLHASVVEHLKNAVRRAARSAYALAGA
jgi:hypothetical protein